MFDRRPNQSFWLKMQKWEVLQRLHCPAFICKKHCSWSKTTFCTSNRFMPKTKWISAPKHKTSCWWSEKKDTLNLWNQVGYNDLSFSRNTRTTTRTHVAWLTSVPSWSHDRMLWFVTWWKVYKRWSLRLHFLLLLTVTWHRWDKLADAEFNAIYWPSSPLPMFVVAPKEKKSTIQWSKLFSGWKFSSSRHFKVERTERIGFIRTG